MMIGRPFINRVRLASASGIVIGLLFASGCGSGERELPVVSDKTKGAAGVASTDYPLGKPAPRKLTGAAAKKFGGIESPTGPGNK
jgi:hypothetical protein